MDVGEFLKANDAPLVTFKASEVNDLDLDLNDSLGEVMETARAAVADGTKPESYVVIKIVPDEELT